ncbi:MAG: hypothetical protein AB1567_00810 [bacterium]
MSIVDEYTTQLLEEMKGLPTAKVKEILDFTCFIKAKEAIDPTQAYFWSKKWQEMEKEADEDREAGRIIGDGTTEGLLKDLKR